MLLVIADKKAIKDAAMATRIGAVARQQSGQSKSLSCAAHIFQTTAAARSLLSLIESSQQQQEQEWAV
jgi:hypothetical protein